MRFFYILLISLVSINLSAQDTISLNPSIRHSIPSEFLNEERTYWIGLPLNYADSLNYPVIYVLDAEWRYELIRNIAFDLGANEKIENCIIVGIPHIDWEYKRGQDLTFSQSRIEYDGDQVDSTWYNEMNSGKGMRFYHYLTKELIPDVNEHYATNGHETLIGHSYGGYFGAYLLSLDQPFEVIHIYDPSIWFSNGEVTKRFIRAQHQQKTKIHLTYQPSPEFHKNKIEEFIEALKGNEHIQLSSNLYENESHNSLFLDSFYQGIRITHKKLQP